jgi:hypothetical protein
MVDQGASTAAANAGSMDAQVTMSNGSRQRLRRVQRRAVLSVIVPESGSDHAITRSRYEGQFERRVSRYPELPSRNPTAIELNDIWTARPEGIDHEKFIHASAKTD